MTLLAGAFALVAGDTIDDAWVDALRQNLSRHPQDEVVVERAADAVLMAVDIGVLGGSGVVRDGGVTVMAGEPLMRDAAGTRFDALKRLHAGFPRNEDMLRTADGQYALAHYDGDRRELVLITDRLGIRPLYVWADERRVVFASALRVLERLPGIPKRLDLRGLTEEGGIGYPLADRTAYEGIRRLPAATRLSFRDGRAEETRYWRWDRDVPLRAASDDAVEETRARLVTAVRRRLRGNRATVAMLSGGLDSRCIVSLLVQQGIDVRTLNFSYAVTQDQSLARAFAAAAGTRHFELHRPSRTADWTAFAASAVDREPTIGEGVERPRVIWSGDGGSVGLGLVYMDEALCASLRTDGIAAGLDHYLAAESFAVPRVFRATIAARLSAALRSSIRAEVEIHDCDDPARAFHLFLMHNDQRRHLTHHFENIDVNRVEYLLPLLDGHVLELILALPVDALLRHAFYHRLVERLGAPANAVPWQTYPGHLPCPISGIANGSPQWSESASREHKAWRTRTAVRNGMRMVRARQFPGELLSRWRVGLVTAATAFRLRDYTYAIEHADLVQRYWQNCAVPRPDARNSSPHDGESR
jgi:hypothetical protein